MKRRIYRASTVTAFVAALCLIAPSSAFGVAGPTPEPSAPAIVPVASPEPAADLTDEEVVILEGYGVEGDVTVQEAADGTAMYLDGEGDWVITPGSGKDDMASTNWSVGVCTGTFHMPRKVGADLEWGGQNSCSGTTSFYLHRIRVQLRDTCLQAWCVQYENLWAYTSPSSQNYSRVVNVTADSWCERTDGRRYDLVATVTVKSVQYRFNSRPVDISNCNVHPAAGGV